MNPTEYQQGCIRTECDEAKALGRMNNISGVCMNDGPFTFEDARPIRLNHAALGLSSEVGEMVGLVRAWVYYGKPLDMSKLKEELGDIAYFLALACDAVGFDLGNVMQVNQIKLRQRYPDKFTEEAYQNRDHEAEDRAMSTTTPPVAPRSTTTSAEAQVVGGAYGNLIGAQAQSGAPSVPSGRLPGSEESHRSPRVACQKRPSEGEMLAASSEPVPSFAWEQFKKGLLQPGPGCPPSQILIDLYHNRLLYDEEVRAKQHLKECPFCESWYKVHMTPEMPEDVTKNAEETHDLGGEG